MLRTKLLSNNDYRSIISCTKIRKFSIKSEGPTLLNGLTKRIWAANCLIEFNISSTSTLLFYSILFIHLYMVPLAVETNQRRPPVQLSPGKRNDLRRRGVEENEPERIWARIFTGSQFHNRGPAEAKAQCCEVDVLHWGTRLLWSKERSGRSKIAESGRMSRGERTKAPWTKSPPDKSPLDKSPPEKSPPN